MKVAYIEMMDGTTEEVRGFVQETENDSSIGFIWENKEVFLVNNRAWKTVYLGEENDK